jgi:hypothetical protein
MVSQRELGRRRQLPLAVALCCGLGSLLGCSRKAEIEDAPDAGSIPVMEVPRPDGGVPLVETAELDHRDGLTCNERPRQPACAGVNDFGCDFDGWLQRLVAECQVQSDCRTDGWVEVLVGPEGCATELRMEDPDAAYVACMSEELRQYQCPCTDVVGSSYLGVGHDGCDTCGTGELRCAPGSNCRDGKCVEEDSSSTGGAN